MFRVKTECMNRNSMCSFVISACKIITVLCDLCNMPFAYLHAITISSSDGNPLHIVLHVSECGIALFITIINALNLVKWSWCAPSLYNFCVYNSCRLSFANDHAGWWEWSVRRLYLQQQQFRDDNVIFSFLLTLHFPS